MGRVIGIDLGTTNSLAAFVDERGAPVVLRDGGGEALVPSVICIDEARRAVVGEAARVQLAADPRRTVYSIKRLMGRGYEDVRAELPRLTYHVDEGTSAQVVRVQIDGRLYTPPELSAMILSELKRRAEAAFGEEVDRAVITVPAYFNDAQRQATRDAGRIAGLDALRILNEPTAACLAYGLDKREDGLVAVYDLGGGTFDISILKLDGGIFQVLSTAGDTHLGGDDFDNALIDHVSARVAEVTGADFSGDPRFFQAVRKAAITAKHSLSRGEGTTLRFSLPDGRDFAEPISRELFEALIAETVARTEGPCLQALKDADVRPEDLDRVLLVGGSTRVPLVRETVERIFGKPGYADVDPDVVVAVGAAHQADIMTSGRKDTLLMDVIPLSLGIESYGGTMSVIIPRNSPIPASSGDEYTTFVDNQTSVLIHVLQGEREFASDNRSLARFKIPIPPMPAGMPRVRVRLLVDANGILNVQARDVRTNTYREIQVKPSHGLTDEEVEGILMAGFEHAEEDFTRRMLIEARNEANTVIRATTNAMKTPQFAALPEEQQFIIGALLDELKGVVDGEDRTSIQDHTEALNQVTFPLAELLMNSAVSDALQSRTVDGARDLGKSEL